MSISYSHLSTALRCPRLYQYQVLEGRKVEGVKSLALYFGTALHAGLCGILKGQSNKDFSFIMTKAKLEKGIFGPDRYSWEEYFEMGQVFLERFSRLHASAFTPVALEERLYGALPNGAKVEGTPDAVALYKGICSVIDFKTSGSAYPKEKAVVSDQMHLYAHMAQKQYKLVVEQLVYVVFVKSSKSPRIQVIKAPLTQEKLAERIANFSALNDNLQTLKTQYSGALLPQNCNACFDYNRRCDFFDVCHGVNVVDEEE